jgi:hypothetical protein
LQALFLKNLGKDFRENRYFLTQKAEPFTVPNPQQTWPADGTRSRYRPIFAESAVFFASNRSG